MKLCGLRADSVMACEFRSDCSPDFCLCSQQSLYLASCLKCCDGDFDAGNGRQYGIQPEKNETANGTKSKIRNDCFFSVCISCGKLVLEYISVLGSLMQGYADKRINMPAGMAYQSVVRL